MSSTILKDCCGSHVRCIYIGTVAATRLSTLSLSLINTIYEWICCTETRENFLSEDKKHMYIFVMSVTHSTDIDMETVVKCICVTDMMLI